MKYKKIISSLSLATALLAVTTLNQEVQANEAPVDTKEKAVVNPSVSENQITEAQKEVKKAQENLDAKAAKDAEAKKQEAKADQKVAETKDAIKVSKNADAIAEEQGKVVAEKGAEKSEADKALSSAQSTDATAKEEAKTAKEASQSATEKRDAKAADVKAKQAELDGMTDAGIQTQISKTEKEIGVADQVLQAETKKANEAADKVAAKQNELDNYKPTVLKNVLNPEEQGHKAPASEDDYEYNKNYRPKDASGNYEMENVAFQGVREVEEEATEEMKRFTKALADYNANPYDEVNHKYKARPTFKFVVDNRKLTEAFIEVANELRRANGVTQDLALDEAYIKHAEERSNEMATTGVLSHDTKFSHPDGEDVRVENIGMKDLIPGSDGGPNFVEVKNGQTIYNYDKIMSYKQFAYESLLAWYADFNNIKGIDYGHRRALLTPVGGKVGVAQGTIEGKNPNNIYYTYTSNAYSPETVEEYRSNFYGFKEVDKLHPTFYGKRMKFLPEHHFVYVEKTVIDKSADIKAELASLQAEKADKDAKKVAAVNKKADLLASLDKLNKQANNLSSSREQVKKDLEQAKSDLATLTADAQAKSELVATKSQEATKASQNLKALQAKVAELATAIKNAEEKRDKAMALKGQASALETTLKQAETDKANAQKVSDQAEAELKLAQTALAEAKAKLQALLDVLEAENMLRIGEKDGIIIGLPKNAPVQDQLPEFDLRKLADKPQGAETKKPREKASTKVLPNTGTNSGVDGQATLFGVYGLLASLGLAGIATRRRRQGK